MILSPCEIATAAVLWMSGASSRDIANELRLSEAAVYNAMPRIRAVSRAARAPALMVVR